MIFFLNCYICYLYTMLELIEAHQSGQLDLVKTILMDEDNLVRCAPSQTGFEGQHIRQGLN